MVAVILDRFTLSQSGKRSLSKQAANSKYFHTHRQATGKQASKQAGRLNVLDRRVNRFAYVLFFASFKSSDLVCPSVLFSFFFCCCFHLTAAQCMTIFTLCLQLTHILCLHTYYARMQKKSAKSETNCS